MILKTNMKFEFEEVKKVEFELDFQIIYNYVKNDRIKNNPGYIQNKWDIHTDFGDNMDYYLKKIYDLEIEDNDYNHETLDYVFQEWSKWIKNYNED